MKYFTEKTPHGFNSLYIRSNDKLTSVANVDTPVNVETPKKNINTTFAKSLTNLDKSKPN